MKKTIINLPNLYDKVIFRIYNQDQFEKVAKYYNQNQIPKAFCVGSDIYLNQNEKSIGFIIHQTIHAILNIMNYRGIKDQQILAYTSQYVIEKYLKKNETN